MTDGLLASPANTEAQMDSTTTTPPIDVVAMIGAGTMGSHIAALTALSGRTVRLYDMDPTAVARSLDLIKTEIMPAILDSGMLPGDGDSALARIEAVDSLESALDGADLMIEAIREHLETKREFFAEVSQMTDAILATNSSSLQSSQIADVVTRPERFLNTHFFQPIWTRSMLEVMSNGQTSPEVIATAKAFGDSLGLATIVVRKDSKGFVINRIWRAIKRESLRVADEGVADPEDIDRLFMIFFQTDEAPFALMDSVGLNVVEDIESTYQAVTQDPTDTRSTILHEKVSRGELGKKSGAGFYTYPDPAYARADFLRSTGDDD